jgi:type VI protein secretion system component VasK
MSLDTIIMIVLICIGCALLLTGLVFLAVSALGLVKAGRRAGISSKDQVQEVIRRSQALAPKVRELATKQKAVAETLRSVSATTNELNYLKDEIDRTTGHLSGLKS